MQLKRPKGKHQCMVASLAMILDKEVDEIIAELGYTGEELVNGRFARAHHIDEFQLYCLRHNYALVPLDANPTIGYHNGTTLPIYGDDAEARFRENITNRRALLLGVTENLTPHCYAWDGEKMYDCRGVIHNLIYERVGRAYLLVTTN